MATLQFLGAAGTVTGSKHLLDSGRGRALVDCGLFQGLKELRQRNWDRLPVAASSIADVVVTHAHLDHVGYLPRLVHQGFEGPVSCTPATGELTAITLRDSAHIQVEDARHANKRGFSKHRPALPLYNPLDAEKSLRLLRPVAYGEPFRVANDSVQMRFLNAGHILGSAIIEAQLSDEPLKVVFTGDLGRTTAPILDDPAMATEADYVVIESTYGNRERPPDMSLDLLASITTETVSAGGCLLIPAFAIERTQDLLYMLSGLLADGRIPRVPIFVDSPMAVEATRVYLKHPELYDADARARVHGLFDASVTYATDAEQSKAINRVQPPMIVLASSGMATAGRILHHMERFLPDPRSTLLLVGYQAVGTRGHLLEAGIPEVKIHGQAVPVRARVRKLEGLSGHADAPQLLAWLSGFTKRPRRVFVVHGEPDSSAALAEAITRELGLDAYVPHHQETVQL